MMNTAIAPTYTVGQLQNLMTHYAKGVIKFRDGEQWVEFDTLTQMKIVIDTLRSELFPEQYAKPIGYIRTRIVKAY